MSASESSVKALERIASALEVMAASVQKKVKEREQKASGPKPWVESKRFLTFWRNYPRKTAIGAAWKSWLKAAQREGGEEKLYAIIAAGMDKWLNSVEWTREEGRFVCHAATWLNQSRYHDSPEQA